MYEKTHFQNDILENEIWDSFWNLESKNVDILWDYMLKVITETADIHCPVKQMKVRDDSPHWMGREIIEELHYKDFLYKKAKISGERVDWVAFRVQNTNVKKMIESVKEDYIKDQLDQNENNPKRFWRNIRDISGIGK